MNNLRILSLGIAVLFGMELALVKDYTFLSGWYWILLITFILYGAINFFDGEHGEKN
jgi:hypothetical protein